MSKAEFLRHLDRALKRLSDQERKEVLQDFDEHFEMGKLEGKTEFDIAEGLGSPKQIAKELLASHHIEKVGTSMTAGNLMRAIWAVIGLGFFNLVIVLGPLAAIVGVIIGFWAVSTGFVLSPFVFLVDLVLAPESANWFSFFASLALCGLGILIGLGLFALTKWLVKGFIRYLQFNVNLVRGGLKT